MTPDDKASLRELRDAMEEQEDKKLLRKTLNHIQTLEGKLHSIRALARAIQNETQMRTPSTQED